MTGAPENANPPIVELVLGVQFSPLTKLTAGHFGLFWKELGDDWTEPADDMPIPDQFEWFDRPEWGIGPGLQLRLEPLRQPGRFTLGHQDKDHLLQVQASRFHLNWRKREGFYPSYSTLIADFEAMFARFAAFAGGAGLGEPIPNQWELTYIDSFPKGEYWDTLADWPTVLPGLFGGLFPTTGLGVALEHRAAEWRYEIEPKRGRLHISAGPGRAGGDPRDSLLLSMTARGPIGKGGAGSLREGLDLGHEAALGAFSRVVSDEARKRWGVES